MTAKAAIRKARRTARRKVREETAGSRADHVLTRIRQGIQTGRYNPGDRIRETEVAGWLKVSRTPVREALRRLEAEGMLTFLPWRGVVVTELDRQQVSELYALRELLEGGAARLAALHISDADIQLLEVVLERADDASDDPATLAKLNRQFHQTIYSASHNRYLSDALAQHRNVLALLKGTTYAVPERSAAAAEEHRAIVAAIRARDPNAAEAAARKHIAAAHAARLRLMLDMEHTSDGEKIHDTI